jgi:hypothetical protein
VLAYCGILLCLNAFVFTPVLKKQYTFEHTVGETTHISM